MYQVFIKEKVPGIIAAWTAAAQQVAPPTGHVMEMGPVARRPPRLPVPAALHPRSPSPVRVPVASQRSAGLLLEVPGTGVSPHRSEAPGSLRRAPLSSAPSFVSVGSAELDQRRYQMDDVTRRYIEQLAELDNCRSVRSVLETIGLLDGRDAKREGEEPSSADAPPLSSRGSALMLLSDALLSRDRRGSLSPRDILDAVRLASQEELPEEERARVLPALLVASAWAVVPGGIAKMAELAARYMPADQREAAMPAVYDNLARGAKDSQGFLNCCTVAESLQPAAGSRLLDAALDEWLRGADRRRELAAHKVQIVSAGIRAFEAAQALSGGAGGVAADPGSLADRWRRIGQLVQAIAQLGNLTDHGRSGQVLANAVAEQVRAILGHCLGMPPLEPPAGRRAPDHPVIGALCCLGLKRRAEMLKELRQQMTGENAPPSPVQVHMAQQFVKTRLFPPACLEEYGHTLAWMQRLAQQERGTAAMADVINSMIVVLQDKDQDLFDVRFHGALEPRREKLLTALEGFKKDSGLSKFEEIGMVSPPRTPLGRGLFPN